LAIVAQLNLPWVVILSMVMGKSLAFDEFDFLLTDLGLLLQAVDG
jgi:hypothetical protein